MKIAIDCRMSRKSGIGTFIDNLLPYFMNSKDEILLFGFKDFFLRESCTSENVKFLLCDVPAFSIKELFFFPKNILNEINKCDLYFTPYCNIPCGIKIPVFSTIHDIIFLDRPDMAGIIGTKIRKFFYKRAVKKSTTIFTVSNFSKERIIHHLKPENEIKVVYAALPDYIKSIKSEKVQKDKSIIFIGNIKAHKGLQFLLPAFTAFRNELILKNEKALPELIIVGSAENFRTKDNSINLENNEPEKNGIRFTGFISNEELHSLLSKARLLVQPSLYEGFGIPPLEALNSGTAALISDIPVFKEIYKDFPVKFFESGNCTDLENKIKEMWNKPFIPENIPDIYSYNKTYNRIMETLNLYL